MCTPNFLTKFFFALPLSFITVEYFVATKTSPSFVIIFAGKEDDFWYEEKFVSRLITSQVWVFNFLSCF